jgi:hypothetical protein
VLLLGTHVGSCYITTASRTTATSCNSLQRPYAFAASPPICHKPCRGSNPSTGICSNFSPVALGPSLKSNQMIHSYLKASRSDFLGLRASKSSLKYAAHGLRHSRKARNSDWKCLNVFYDNEGNDEVRYLVGSERPISKNFEEMGWCVRV